MMKPSWYISFFLKLCVIVCSCWGVYLNASDEVFFDNPNALLFFTIQSNIWIMVTCLVGLVKMLQGKKTNHSLAVLKLMFTVAITLTGVVYCTMLAPHSGPDAWELKSNLVHVAVPIAAVLDFFVCGRFWNENTSSVRRRRYPLSGRDSLWVIVPPFYYFVFAAIGYICGWNFSGGSNYPYFFLNWGSPAGAFGFCKGLPYMGVMWYFLVLLVALILVGRLYIWIGNRLQPDK